MRFLPQVVLPALAVAGEVYNTFDGDGFAACYEVAKVYRPSSIDEIVSIVQDASAAGTPVRASGNGHMWYDTMCSDDPSTIIIKTDAVNGISDLQMNDDGTGSVLVEAGVTFPQLAEWLQDRDAALGYTLVNWNITIAGAVAMGAHRSSLGEDSQVSSAALALDIINGKGELVHLDRDQSNDTWLAATTSLGLLGVIARVEMMVLADYKVWANQTTVDEDDVLNGDLYEEISPYVTANYWWWPGQRKFHKRTYGVVPADHDGDAFQSTFSLTDIEGSLANTLLGSGQNNSWQNFITEGIFYALWSAPNFHSESTDLPLLSWPVYGSAYEVLIGGLYPNQKPEWDYGLHGKTLELAVPITQANALLKRVRELLDQSKADGKAVTATYRSGINIKVLWGFNHAVGVNRADIGAMMFDFPSFKPSTGNGDRFNEECVTSQQFPVRPHWTKNTRDVFKQSVKNLNPDSLATFAAVRKRFDPDGIFKSVVGEILGVMD
ncbi:FAD-binding domain-containing protein [Cylindrobasidium torrendii FP15055 ss-10]|uniref:FAD-binding domain-containing protein n=1 Tax=Cylindrobasidium torrendii FP15055 ss-10 TaxID=1314674 RepID=A0A0D7BE17_9AGAR|nr:FAD-binding domain-containing protein [Cylindrobasidium torrendii FP15055 ss-10]